MRKLVLFLLFFTLSVLYPAPIPSPPKKQNLNMSYGPYDKSIRIDWFDLFSIGVTGFGLVSLYWIALLYLCNHVNFVPFDTDLTLFKKKPKPTEYCPVAHISLVMLGLLVFQYPDVLIQ